MRVKMNTIAVMTPAWTKPPPVEKLPISPRSGVDVTLSGHFGTCSSQSGLPFDDGMVATASMMTARIVEATIEIRMAPGTRRANSVMVSSSPKQNTTTGQPTSVPLPLAPRLTGVAAGVGVVPQPAAPRPREEDEHPVLPPG